MLEERLLDLLHAVRGDARAQGLDAEFHFHRERSSLIRLGNSSVALSTSEELTRFSITVQDGRRSGSYGVTADLVSREQAGQILRRAAEACAASPEMDFTPLLGVVEEDVDDSRGFDPALAELSPEAKADLCAAVIHAVKPRGDYDFSGSWSSGATEVYVASTANDRDCYRRLTDSRLVLVLKDSVRRWELTATAGGKCAGDVRADDIIATFDRLLPIYEGQPGYQAPLGRARVLFGPQAFADLVGLALWGGFVGRMWVEKRAFTSALQPGAPLFSPLVTLTDSPDDPHVFGMPFDAKGRRRRRFDLVTAGVFRAVPGDSATAAKYAMAPTGHEGGSWDVALAPGDAPAGLDAGRALAGDALYIPHLHYTHLPDPSVGQFTGSSRFNALRLSGGEFVAPLFSTRLADTLPNVLSNVVAVSSRAVMENVSSTYGPRSPEAISVPEYLLCDNVRVSDVADSF